MVIANIKIQNPYTKEIINENYYYMATLKRIYNNIKPQPQKAKKNLFGVGVD